jgi:hypothetical protein
MFHNKDYLHKLKKKIVDDLGNSIVCLRNYFIEKEMFAEI